MPTQTPQDALEEQHTLIRQTAQSALGRSDRLDPQDIKLATGGTQGAVFLVPPLRAVFKFYTAKQASPHDIGRGIAVQNAAAESGLPIPRILVPLSAYGAGSFYAEEMAPGKMLGIFKNKGAAPEQIEPIGRKLGQFIADFDRNLGNRAGDFGVAAQPEPDLAATRLKIAALEEPVRQGLGAHLDWAVGRIEGQPPGPRRLIHGDISSSNTIVTPQNGIMVVDFGVVKHATIEHGLRMLCFNAPPLLQSTIAGYREKSGNDVSLPTIARHAIEHFSRFPPPDQWKEEWKPHREKMVGNLTRNLDLLFKMEQGSPAVTRNRQPVRPMRVKPPGS